jgi:transcriptional regulator with XRE-family HTH domain
MTSVQKVNSRVDLETTDDHLSVSGLPERLKAAREAARYSRAQVAQQTGIPQKSIEKFEGGDQEPSVSRLITLADFYGTSTQQLLGTVEQIDELPQPSKQTSESSELTSAIDQARALLDELDEHRENTFIDATRRGVAAATELRSALKSIEPDGLIALARERDVYTPTMPTLPQLKNLFVTQFEAAQGSCSKLEDRIIDTAILGVDLHSIGLASLDTLADQLEIDERPWGGWKKHDALVPLLRQRLHILAFSGKGEDFANTEKYPYRDNAEQSE